jgi:hypothetical protein
MALVRTMSKTSKDRQSVHRETECSFSTFSDELGQVYLQLDTFGSKARKMPGKESQSIQFDRRAALQLRDLINEIFH